MAPGILKVIEENVKIMARNKSGTLCTLGGFLLLLCFALDFSYSNLNTYITSYMRRNGYKSFLIYKTPSTTCFLHRHNKGLGYEDFIYVTAMKNFIAGVLTPVGGFMAIRLGARPVMALGCLIMA